MKTTEEVYDCNYLLKNIKLLRSKYEISKIFTDFLIMGAYKLYKIKYGINARVILGNSLTNDIQYMFYTPFAILFPIK